MSAEGTDYYDAVLGGIGAPDTPTNVRRLVAWQKAEGGDAANNAFNTTQPEPGATNFNPVGVKNYPDKQTGILATVKTLLNGHYPDIVTGLQADSDSAFAPANDPEIRTWGTDPNVIRQNLGVVDVSTIPTTSPGDTGTVTTVGGTTVTAAAAGAAASSPVIKDDGSISSDLLKFTVYGVAALAGAALVVGGAWRGLQPAREKASEVAQGVQDKVAGAAKVAAVA